jgi:hypothetical protein
MSRDGAERRRNWCELHRRGRMKNEQSVGTGSGGHLVPRDRIRGICGAVDAHLSEAFGSADGVRRNQMARGAALTAQV